MSSPNEDFTIEQSRKGDAVVLTLRGELDLATADGVTRRLALHRDRHEPVILDLDTLGFIDSSGLRVILQAVEDGRREDWSFQITEGSEAVRRLIEAAGLTGRLPVI